MTINTNCLTTLKRSKRRFYNQCLYIQNMDEYTAYSIVKQITGEKPKQQKEYAENLKIKLMEELGGVKCKRCGFDDIRALQFDHIKGLGNLDPLKRKNQKTRLFQYYNDLKWSKENLQVLCANCNWIKRHENNESNQYM